jgi:hypothetical protein
MANLYKNPNGSLALTTDGKLMLAPTTEQFNDCCCGGGTPTGCDLLSAAVGTNVTVTTNNPSYATWFRSQSGIMDTYVPIEDGNPCSLTAYLQATNPGPPPYQVAGFTVSIWYSAYYNTWTLYYHYPGGMTITIPTVSGGHISGTYTYTTASVWNGLAYVTYTWTVVFS